VSPIGAFVAKQAVANWSGIFVSVAGDFDTQTGSARAGWGIEYLKSFGGLVLGLSGEVTMSGFDKIGCKPCSFEDRWGSGAIATLGYGARGALPYIGLGIAFHNTSNEGASISSGQRFGWMLASGVLVPITEALSGRVELRHYEFVAGEPRMGANEIHIGFMLHLTQENNSAFWRHASR
jgi:opacity protein-like surface antigen